MSNNERPLYLETWSIVLKAMGAIGFFIAAILSFSLISKGSPGLGFAYLFGAGLSALPLFALAYAVEGIGQLLNRR